MRRFALPIALSLAVAGAVPVLADGGLPEIASLQAGPFSATVHNDAPTLVTGSNTLTVEIPAVPERDAVSLSVSGPRGERVEVPLRPLQVLEGPADAHSGHGDTHAAAQTTGTPMDANMPGMSHDMSSASHDMPGMSHEMPGMSHETPVDAHQVVSAHAASDAHSGTAETYRARGSISIPEGGTWQARLVISEAAGASFVAEAPLIAQDGGPNPLYLALTGTLTGGFLVYGATQRRRNTPVTLTAR